MADPATFGSPREPLAGGGMIRVEIAEKRFGDAAILQGINLNVDPGECVALLGPSGIGKTTLMRIAAGLDADFTGQASAPLQKAMVFQEPNLLPWRRVDQNLTLFHPHLSPADVAAALEQVGLAGREAHYPTQLSLGQQRRLALARAFAGAPQALFLDEPFASLDTDRAHEMQVLTRDLIAQHRPAVLFITHSAEEAAALATRTLRLSGQPATLSDQVS